VGDLISPFKAAVGLDYKELERKLLAAIHIRFGLPARLPAAVTQTIKRADRMSAYLEAIGLAGFSESEGKRFFGRYTRLPEVDMTPVPAYSIKTQFLERFAALAPFVR
jgi:5'-deoxynucleotidase YfbR-like HD superfamily hydrolase